MEENTLMPELTKKEKALIVKFLGKHGNRNKCAELTGLHTNTINKVKNGGSLDTSTILTIKDFIKTYLNNAA